MAPKGCIQFLGETVACAVPVGTILKNAFAEQHQSQPRRSHSRDRGVFDCVCLSLKHRFPGRSDILVNLLYIIRDRLIFVPAGLDVGSNIGITR
jgi:hypothetical protein